LKKTDVKALQLDSAVLGELGNSILTTQVQVIKTSLRENLRMRRGESDIDLIIK